MKTFLRFLCAAACCVATTVAAQTFNNQIRLSNNPAPSIQPVVTAVGSNVYVVWVENLNNGGACTDGSPGPYCGDIWFSRSIDNGASFSAPLNLTAGTNARNDQLPLIAAGGTQVHVFWTDSPVTGEIHHRRSTDSGASFAADTTLTADDAFYSRPTGALVDAGGNVHLAFYDNKPPAGDYGQVYYRCSANQGSSFSAEVNINQFDGSVDNEQPRLVQGTDGTIYMLFRSSRAGKPFGGFPPNDQFMLRSSAAASGCVTTWLKPAQKVSPGLPAEFANSFAGNFVAGAGNVLHAAYWSDKAGTNLVYRRGFPNGRGWETPFDLSGFGTGHLQWDGNVADMTGFGIGEDGAGKVHTVFGENNELFEGFQRGNLWYRCSNDGGATWVAKTLATTEKAAMPRAHYANNRFHVVWMDWRDLNTGAEIYYRNVTTGACSAAAANLSVSVPSINFGGQSMGTTSPSVPVTVTNTGGGSATITGVSTSAQFGQTNNCTVLAASASCIVNVTFTPAAAAGAINSTTAVNGSLNITSSSGNPSVTLAGTGEKSLVTHYYRSILRRAPDAGGFTFWGSEATRMQGLGANVNEAWYALSAFFFFSGEYLAFNRDNTGFVTDLYFTFFNRGPDAPGLAYWVGELNSGMPREVVLAAFMFSTEFSTFTQGIFGNTAARAEVDMVGDFFRGLLARLPDTDGFNFWVGQFRAAQCTGAGAVYARVEEISNLFVISGEYAARNRTNAQFVGDLYNAFLRRGGDLGGVNFWINQLNTAAMTRSFVRQQFIASGEFTTRVNAVVNQGCLP